MSCRHDATTIVEDHRENVGAFLNTQCDVCGMCLPRAPIVEATFYAWYDGKLRVPAVDRDAYAGAIDAALMDVFSETSEVGELQRFAKVAGHG
jgi:hypothetical protein